MRHNINTYSNNTLTGDFTSPWCEGRVITTQSTVMKLSGSILVTLLHTTICSGGGHAYPTSSLNKTSESEFWAAYHDVHVGSTNGFIRWHRVGAVTPPGQYRQRTGQKHANKHLRLIAVEIGRKLMHPNPGPHLNANCCGIAIQFILKQETNYAELHQPDRAEVEAPIFEITQEE